MSREGKAVAGAINRSLAARTGAPVRQRGDRTIAEYTGDPAVDYWVNHSLEEVIEGMLATDRSEFLDAIWDQLGVTMVALQHVEFTDLIHSHGAYVKSQEDRGRETEMVHHDLISLILLIVCQRRAVAANQRSKYADECIARLVRTLVDGQYPEESTSVIQAFLSR